jgi:hypothetical protein
VDDHREGVDPLVVNEDVQSRTAAASFFPSAVAVT